MDDCIFCKIGKGEIPCAKLYEDDNYVAFLDIQPFSRGHVLVLPKSHYANIMEMPEDLLCGLMSVVKKLSQKIQTELKPSGIFINQNNGEKAGQSVMHFHVHIKPIYEDTKLFISEERNVNFPDEEKRDLIQKLKIN